MATAASAIHRIIFKTTCACLTCFSLAENMPENKQKFKIDWYTVSENRSNSLKVIQQGVLA
jgi:hypothetical protein